MSTSYVLDVPLTLAETAYNYPGGSLPSGFTNPAPITVGPSSWPLIRKISASDPVFGFSCQDAAGNVYVTYHGTRTQLEWVDDFDFVMERNLTGCVHRGFAELFRATIDSLPRRAGGKLICCGHSLGGPLATHAALHLGADELYTFESPRVGDQAFADAFNATDIKHYRIFNEQDPIACVPPRPFSAHCGGGIRLNGWSVAPNLWQKFDIWFQHRIETVVRPCLKRLPTFVTPEALY